MVTRLICHLFGAFLIFELQAAEQFWDEIPLSPSTTVPSEVLDDYWNSQFVRVNREVAAAKNARLVSTIDSLIINQPNLTGFENLSGLIHLLSAIPKQPLHWFHHRP